MVDPPPSTLPLIDEIMLNEIRQRLASHAWVVAQDPHLAMCHTLGLTVYGLPELVIGHAEEAHCQQLDRWAARLVAGELLLGAKVTVQDLELREHTFLTRRYDIDSRGGLWLARALYGRRLAVRELDLRSCPCLPCRAEV